LSYAKWRVFKGFQLCCSYEIAPEQKARTTYDNILRLVKDDPDVYDAIKFLRAREIVHFQRFGESLRIVQDNLNSKNFYAFNPAFDNKKC
jgi:Mn-containing catalase